MSAEEYHPGTRVARAAEYLDAHYPGWAERVDLSDFDMGEGDRCVGWYAVGYATDDQEAWATLAQEIHDNIGLNTSGLFSAYGTEWTEEITKRKEANVPA